MTRYFGKSFIQKHETVDPNSQKYSLNMHGPGGNYIFICILTILFSNVSFDAAKILSRAGRSLHEVQTHLDKEGASNLVVELVIKSVHSSSIFEEAILLGTALLEGGNPIIQNSMYNKLMGGDLSQSFFKVRLFII